MSRHSENSSGDRMALNSNGNRDVSYDAVGGLASYAPVASSSNGGQNYIHLNGPADLRGAIKAPEAEVKTDSMIKRLTPSATVTSFQANMSGENGGSAAEATYAANGFDYQTLNGKNDEKPGFQQPFMVVKESQPPMNGLAEGFGMADGTGSQPWNPTMDANGGELLRPSMAHLVKEQEFRSFLQMDSNANPINLSTNVGSNGLGARPFIPYQPAEGESLLRLALLNGKNGIPGYQFNGYNKPASCPVAPTVPIEQEDVPNPSNEDENSDNSDVDVELLDEVEAAGVSQPMDLNGLSNLVEANADNGSELPAVREARASTVQKRKLSELSSKTDAKKGFSRSSDKEDEKSLAEMPKQKVMAFIQKESKKPQPDFSKLSEAMDITYYSKRKTMYDQGLVSVRDIKKKFPELLHYKMVKEELGRILKDPTKMERLERELGNAVLSSALEGKKKTLIPGKKRHPIWKKTIQLWEENKESINSAHYRNVLGMLAVCFEFAENAVVTRMVKVLKQDEKLMDSEIKKMDIPVIVVRESEIFNVLDDAEIWIYVDGQKYLKVPNMYEAVLTMFSVYYIFNIAYDKSLKSLLEFFDYLCDNPQSTYPNTQ